MALGNAGIRIIKFALAALAGALAGCATAPAVPRIAIADLPNCFESNYDAQRRLFTIKDLYDIWANPTKNPANQQCLLTVGPSGSDASASRLAAGLYTVYVANGGGGGAGGTLQSPIRGVAGGGGGGGGAGAEEMRSTVYLTEGVYKLTLGAGGPGGRVCAPAENLAGGPGWAGSPSNIVSVATGEVIAGVPGADAYARPTVFQNERLADTGRPGQGGFGPGQTSGGAGARPQSAYAYSAPAEAGTSTLKPVQAEVGIALGFIDALRPSGAGGARDAGTAAKGRGETQSQTGLPPTRDSVASGGGVAAGAEPIYTARAGTSVGPSGVAPEGTGAGGAPGYTAGPGSHPSGGGGGGATSAGAGGSGGGENLRHRDQPPVPGSLGSGGGGGEGSTTGCDPGARGGHGYIAFRPI